METDLINHSNSQSVSPPEDTRVIATLRAIEPPGLPRFRLGLRIHDDAGEREVFLPSDALTVGSSADDSITISAPGVVPGHLRLWRHALSLIGARFQPEAPVEVEPLQQAAHPLVARAEPLIAGTTLRLGGAVLQVILDNQPAPKEGDFHGLVGRSFGMGKLYVQTAQLARSDVSVVIQGPSGTGKEAIAKAMHTLGLRASGKFVAVNCGGCTEEHISDLLFGHERGSFTGAIGANPGMFEVADGGTLFLDEIGDLPINLQVRLLRALQEGEVLRLGATEVRTVDVRVVAATNVDLVKALREGRFREDLYYRLASATIFTPRLVDRFEDLPRLVEYFLAKYGAEGGPIELDPEAWQGLLHYRFPGNVRELASMLRVAIARLAPDRVVRLCDLPFSPLGLVEESQPEEPIAAPSAGQLDTVIDVRGKTEAEVIAELRRMAVRMNGGNKTAAARALGLGRTTLRDIEP